MSERTDSFTQALHTVDGEADTSPMEQVFAADAELTRPELPHSGRGGGDASDVAAFWSAYRDQFDSIETEFTHTAEEGDLAVLEWRSSGTLSAGRDIEYAGVSVLSFDGEDKVSRFTTYFDTAAFIEPTAESQR